MDFKEVDENDLEKLFARRFGVDIVLFMSFRLSAGLCVVSSVKDLLLTPIDRRLDLRSRNFFPKEDDDPLSSSEMASKEGTRIKVVAGSGAADTTTPLRATKDPMGRASMVSSSSINLFRSNLFTGYSAPPRCSSSLVRWLLYASTRMTSPVASVVTKFLASFHCGMVSFLMVEVLQQGDLGSNDCCR